jgi:CRP/FNR family transcriptional regulator, cyclic AMP receptor protein
MTRSSAGGRLVGSYQSPKPVGAFMKALPSAERAMIEASGIVRQYAAGTPVMHEGDPTNHVLIIRRGCVKVVAAAPRGARFILGIRGPDDIVGEQASLGGRPRRGTVQTVDRVEALVVPGHRFTRLLAERPAISLALNHVLSERLAEADRYRLPGSFGAAPMLARLMLDLAERYGTPTAGGGRTLGVGLTQSDLADCLAVSPRTVARVLASWRRIGAINTARRRIVIQRLAVLQSYAGPLRE